MSSQYARTTQVGTERSRAEIERLVRRFGASGFAYAWTEDAATIAFHVGNLTIRIVLPLPHPADPAFWLTPTKRRRTERQAQEAYEAEVRRRWRALVAVIKAKLVAVEDNISTMEQEFLAYVVLPNGQTLGEWAGPQLNDARPLPLLPAPRALPPA